MFHKTTGLFRAVISGSTAARDCSKMIMTIPSSLGGGRFLSRTTADGAYNAGRRQQQDDDSEDFDFESEEQGFGNRRGNSYGSGEDQPQYGRGSGEQYGRGEYQQSGRDFDQGERTQRRYRAGMNRVSLLGGIAQRPLEKTGRSGQPYVFFNLITNSESHRASGETLEHKEMHSVMAFGPLARYALNNLDKGTRAFIAGRLHYTGGVPLSDGTRSPRSTFVNAEHIVPFNSTRGPREQEQSELVGDDFLGREESEMELDDQRDEYDRK